MRHKSSSSPRIYPLAYPQRHPPQWPPHLSPTSRKIPISRRHLKRQRCNIITTCEPSQNRNPNSHIPKIPNSQFPIPNPLSSANSPHTNSSQEKRHALLNPPSPTWLISPLGRPLQAYNLRAQAAMKGGPDPRCVNLAMRVSFKCTTRRSPEKV